MSKYVPDLVVFAGPNGSGKSTIIERFMTIPKIPDLYINADNIARDLHVTDLEAGRLAVEQYRAALRKGRPFVIETVMSTHSKINMMEEAKSRGYRVILTYVILQDPAINLDRVRARVEEGGHNVPPDKILARYDRSKKLLPIAFGIADIAYVFNNSFNDPVLIAEKTIDGITRTYPQVPPSKWSEENIKKLLGIEGDDLANDIYPKFY